MAARAAIEQNIPLTAILPFAANSYDPKVFFQTRGSCHAPLENGRTRVLACTIDIDYHPE
jgi:hypothetical protein